MGKMKPNKSKRPKGKNGRAESVRVGDSDLQIDILTLEGAAEFLGVPADKLREDAESRRVPAQHVGGEWRFTKQALYHWLTWPLALGASDLGPPVGMERITKSMPKAPTTPNASQLSSLGSMADDETLPAMVDEIYRRRTEG
jgi:excisionase family DNA binding protein